MRSPVIKRLVYLASRSDLAPISRAALLSRTREEDLADRCLDMLLASWSVWFGLEEAEPCM